VAEVNEEPAQQNACSRLPCATRHCSYSPRSSKLFTVSAAGSPSLGAPPLDAPRFEEAEPLSEPDAEDEEGEVDAAPELGLAMGVGSAVAGRRRSGGGRAILLSSETPTLFSFFFLRLQDQPPKGTTERRTVRTTERTTEIERRTGGTVVPPRKCVECGKRTSGV
jgi:hypothetical protein